LYQSDNATLAATVEISIDGVLFISGTNLTIGSVISYSTHLIRAIKFERTAGAGKVIIVGR